MLRSRTLKTIPAAVVALTMLLPLALPLAPAVEAASGTPTYTNYAGPTDFSRFPQGSPVAFINGGEPSVGVNWNTGAVLYQHGFDTYRVDLSDTSSESTWTDVSPPNTQFNVDPLLYTDPVTGRTFAGGLDGTCSVLAFTDDDGGTWTPMGNPCVATLDHPSIVSGPWRNGVPLPGATYDRAVYYCAQASFVTCTMSMDGGLTFGPAAQVSCQFINPGLHGSAHVAPDGRVYIPFKNCGGQIGVARSDNHGLSWTWSKVAGSTTPQRGFDPDVATTPSGWVYISYQNGDNGAYAALSKNHGRTWSTPVDLGASLGLTDRKSVV